MKRTNDLPKIINKIVQTQKKRKQIKKKEKKKGAWDEGSSTPYSTF